MGSCSSSQAYPPSNQTISMPSQTQSDRDQKNEDVPTTSANSLERAKADFERKYAQPSSNTVKIEDFQLERTIAMTTFGRVMLAKHNNQLVSLKVTEKRKIIEFNRVKQILSEKSILQAVNSPFIVNLIYAFKDNDYLYLALEFAGGGDMYSNKVDKYSESQACFYAAQIVLVLEHLHYLDIIYRNLKPENILFVTDGYIKITDFEFAKVVKGRTRTLCGTPDYLAPEIVCGSGHDKGVDYWALGILIYEMTTGSTPFMSEDPMETFKKILGGSYTLPEYFSSDLTDLLDKLLKVRSTERYGCLKAGTEDIKNHPWFSSIDWLAISDKRLQAPFTPRNGEDHYEKYVEEPLICSETDLYPNEFEQF